MHHVLFIKYSFSFFHENFPPSPFANSFSLPTAPILSSNASNISLTTSSQSRKKKNEQKRKEGRREGNKKRIPNSTFGGGDSHVFFSWFLPSLSFSFRGYAQAWIRQAICIKLIEPGTGVSFYKTMHLQRFLAAAEAIVSSRKGQTSHRLLNPRECKRSSGR